MKFRRFAAVAVVGSLVLAACGGDDDSDATETIEVSETTAATEATEPAATSAPATTAAAEESTTEESSTAESTTSSEESSEAAEPEGTFGGTLVHLAAFEAPSLDVLLGRADAGPSSDAVMLNAIYDVLFYEDAETGEVRTKLAESLESTDFTTWTLTLRPDINFSDGTPLNAEAVKYNWDRIADPANASRNAAGPLQIETLTVVDDLTLEMKLKAVNATFDRDLAATVPWIASPTAIEAAGANYGVDNAVGAGPFVLESWTRDSEMVLTRNPDYWNAPLPYLDELIIRQVPDPEARIQTWLAGDADTGSTSTQVELATRAEEAGGLLAPTFAPIGGLAYVFNTTKPPFDDVRARVAITQAIDRHMLNDVVQAGLSDPVDYLIREPSPFYNEEYVHEFDHDAAQALLDELADEGKPLSFTFVTTAAGLPLTEGMQAQLLGYDNISVEIEQIENTNITARGNAGDFEALITQSVSFDPSPFYEMWTTGSRRNTGGYSNPDMDAALAAQRSTGDLDERKAAIDTVQEIALQDAPWFFFSSTKSYWFHYPEVMGLDNMSRQGPRWDEVYKTS
jgi:peptide/nickel transport system substrate-binding protein